MAESEPIDIAPLIRGGGAAWRGLALCVPSAADVIARTTGAITKPETLNYRTGKPEAAGLFDAAVFGPFVDAGPAMPALDAAVGPMRFGRIHLAAPVLHPLLVRRAPEHVAARAGLTREALVAIDEVSEDHPVTAADEIVGQHPELGILELVMLPGELRPMRRIADDRWATSDLNDLYRRVINRTNRCARLIELGAPEIIIRNERRMLNQAIAALFENEQLPRPVTGPDQTVLASIDRGFAAAGGWDAIAELAQRIADDRDALAGPLPFRLRSAAAHLFALNLDLRARHGSAGPAVSLVPQGGVVPVPY